jgi:amidase
MEFEDYARHDSLGLAELVHRKEVSAAELVNAALARMDEVNPRINAVVHRFDDTARSAAERTLPEGPFRGVPFLVKGLTGAVAGAPLTKGCRALRNHVAPFDSELIARYRRAGVVFVGMTNTPELGLSATTEPQLYGPTRNPWNLGRTSGGSSGGAAAAVAAGIVPAAHGGDSGGSIRIPASACGLFGFKPTRGRMPRGPDPSDGWNGCGVPHVITRSVRDSAAFLDVSHGADIGAPYVAPEPEHSYRDEVGQNPGRLRIALVRRSMLGEHTHGDCLEACEDAAGLVSSLGHHVEEATLPISSEEIRTAYLTVVAVCAAAEVDNTAKLAGHAAGRRLFEASTWFLRQVGHAFSAVEFEQARIVIGGMSRAIGDFFTRYDVVMTPTLAYPPVRIGELGLEAVDRAGLALLRQCGVKSVLKRVLFKLAAGTLEKTANTMLFNMTGQPAMSVPLWWNAEGLPIGVQFGGRFGGEATLLRLASQLEHERPWTDRRPPLAFTRRSS